MEARLNLEDAPASLSDELRSQNNDQTSALLHAASQVLDVGWWGEGVGAEEELERGLICLQIGKWNS